MQFLISLEVIVSIRVFNIGNKRMFLADLDVIISQLILIMLILSAFDLILIRIFRVFVKV